MISVNSICYAAAAGRRAAPAPPVVAASAAMEPVVDQTLNPRVAALKPSKTMALTDLGRQMKEDGVDIIELAAGEPDFDTPAPILEAGIRALRRVSDVRGFRRRDVKEHVNETTSNGPRAFPNSLRR